MTTAVTIVPGLNKWKEYTKPFIDSFREHELWSPLMIVDNGSKPPYPSGNSYFTYRLDTTTSFAASLNEGIQFSYTSTVPDWFVLINNDVLIEKPFIERVKQLDPGNLYGFHQHVIEQRPYLSAWCMFIPLDLWLDVGDFDPDFAPMFYEDADYSWRTVQKGYNLALLDRKDWGIHHIERKRWHPDGESAQWRKDNLERLLEKHDLR